jgi:protoporphyrinogen oxidase
VPRDVVVLGAGPAGLAAAYRLALDGASVAVLEQHPVPGGLASSFEVAGVRVDHGSHRLHPSCRPELLALLRGLLGDDLQRRRRNGRIRLQGRWVSFPPRPLDLARRLPAAFAAGVAFDTVTAPLRRARSDTFADVVRAGLGPTMAHTFYEPYVHKIWAVAPEDLSGELARRRVPARSARDLLGKVVVRGNSASGTFFYPKRGFGEICERLADAAGAAGVELCFGARVAGIAADASSVETCTTDGRTVSSSHVFSTLPLPVLARLTRNGAGREVMNAIDALEYRALALVYLALDRPRYTEYDAHYFPELGTPFSRVSEAKNYRDGRGTDPDDRTVLCAEVPCSIDDETWSASDAVLGDLVGEALAAQGLPAVRPIEVRVRRVPTAYPVYRAGYERHLDAIERWVAALPGVVTFGRHGLFAHDNTHHALAMGWAAAESLRRGVFDAARWGHDREAFRHHVVAD